MPGSVRRRARRSAGADVLAESYRLLDDLLVLEERAFAEIDAAFLRYEPLAVRAMSGQRVPALLADQTAWAALAHAADLAVAESKVIVSILWDQATEEKIRSIDLQLTLCASTLAAKWADLPAAGVSAAQEQLADLLELAQTALAKQTAGLGVGLSLAVRDLLVDVDELDPALVFGPGGVWWRPTGDLKLIARTIEFEMINALQVTATAGFNAAAS